MTKKVTSILPVAIAAICLLDASRALADPTADPALQAWWKFDGTLDDETGNHTVTRSGGGGSTFADSPVGQALQVDGGDDFHLIDNPVSLTGTSGTIVYRFNMPDITQEHTLIARGGNSGTYYISHLVRGDTVWVEAKNHVSSPDNDGAENNMSDHISANSWHTVVVTSDDTEYRMWIDGAEVTLTHNPNDRKAENFLNNGEWWDPQNSLPPPAEYQFTFGGLQWQSTGHISGQSPPGTMIDDVASWSRVLSDAEILSISGPLGVAGIGVAAGPPISTWQPDTSGSWHEGASWSGSGVPNANNHTAIFGENTSEPHVVFTETDVTVRSIQFDHDVSYAIAGFGTVNLESGSVGEGINAGISVAQGSHQFQAPVKLNSPTGIDVAEVGMLTFNGALDLNANTLTKTGVGEMAIRNDLLTGGGTINVLEGMVSGSGTVAGDVNNVGGTISPGNRPGIMEIAGEAVPEPPAAALAVLALVFLAATGIVRPYPENSRRQAPEIFRI